MNMKQTCLSFGSNPIRDAISRIRFAPHSNHLLISSWDSSLRLYDVDACKLTLEASDEYPLLDCCFADDSLAFSAATDGLLRRYDLNSGDVDRIGSHDEATCVEYSNETSLAITAGWDKKIKFWDTRLVKSLQCLENLGGEVESMSLSEFHLMIAVGTSVSTYDLRKLSKLDQAKESFMDVQIKCVRPGFEGFAVGSFDGRVALEYVNDSNSKSGRYAFRCHPKKKDGRHHIVPVNDIAFNPRLPTIFVTGDNEGYASTWDAQSKKRLYELPRFPNAVASLSYSYDGLLLAVASSYTYQEANEREELPQIFLHEINDLNISSLSAGSSK
ncbi:mitotic checkpoint protein BUB3.3 [Coffea arabica]|nr:mitotic checkpoint protein BUB3.3-like [Coffea arabica]